MLDSDFAETVAKGARLLALLSRRDTRADTPVDDDNTSQAQSIFTAYTDLADHGYIEEPTPEPFTLEPLRECLRGLGVDDKMEDVGGKNVAVYHVHSEERVIDGERYPPTQAYFSQITNHSDGVLVAHANNTAPHMGILSEPPTTTYPPLHHWSDIAYLQYLGASPPADTLNLNFVIRYSIHNLTTIAVITRILEDRDVEVLPKWPGITFAAESEEGKAVLGTPNGSGTVYLLAQHGAKVGRKGVGRVTVFYAEGVGDLWRWPSLVFWLEDKEEGKENEEEDEEDERSTDGDMESGEDS